MADGPSPLRYGTPNLVLIRRWLALEPEQDGPFWAVNLMRYRAVADYGDGRPAGISGREADDRYAPRAPLEAVGAVVALHADVVAQPAGEPGWHRVGIVRYPTRSAFFAMQQRDDFRELHEHKDAGMEQTIVLAGLPTAQRAGGPGRLVAVVERGGDASWTTAPGVHPVAELDVEGVIVGDGRTWERVTVACVEGEPPVPEAEEAFVVVLEPDVDQLAASIETADWRRPPP